MVFYFRGLKNTPAHLSAIAELAWPISALVIGYFYFHERFTITQFIGTGILLFSMYHVVRLKNDHE